MNKASLYILLSIFAANTFADEGSTPAIKGGFTASVGTFYLTPSADNTGFAYDSNLAAKEASALDIVPGYDFGVEASIGYIFEQGSNALDFAYRHFITSDSTSKFGQETPFGDSGNYDSDLSYKLNAFDLMASHFMHVGHRMEMRLSGGLTYVELKQTQDTAFFEIKPHYQEYVNKHSQFKGLGPRIGLDARYDVGYYGIGLLGGTSAAFFFGDLDSNIFEIEDASHINPVTVSDDTDNHTTPNFRANLGIDYVYFFGHDKKGSFGVELGYMVDYYNDVVLDLNFSSLIPVTFSGPYLTFKGGY